MEFSRGDVLRFLVVGIRKKGSHTRMDIFSVVSVGVVCAVGDGVG